MNLADISIFNGIMDHTKPLNGQSTAEETLDYIADMLGEADKIASVIDHVKKNPHQSVKERFYDTILDDMYQLGSGVSELERLGIGNNPRYSRYCNELQRKVDLLYKYFDKVYAGYRDGYREASFFSDNDLKKYLPGLRQTRWTWREQLRNGGRSYSGGERRDPRMREPVQGREERGASRGDNQDGRSVDFAQEFIPAISAMAGVLQASKALASASKRFEKNLAVISKRNLALDDIWDNAPAAGEVLERFKKEALGNSQFLNLIRYDPILSYIL